MVRNFLKKVTSAVTTVMLTLTTFAAAIPVTTYAATTVRSKTELKKQGDPAGTGYGTFVFASDVGHGVTFTHSSNLKKADKSSGTKDWIWASEADGGHDEGLSSAATKKRLGDAYISKLESGKKYWVKYSNVAKDGTTKKYDVKVEFSNPVGAISNAYGKDIAVFDGQLGAVRFRGYKHLDCTLYVYEHGTNTLVSGNDNKLHFRFIDIDCNQAVEVLTPGRVDWWYLKSKVEWFKSSECSKIGATLNNTFGAVNDATADDDAIQIVVNDKTSAADKAAYNSAVRHTAALGFTPPSGYATTFKVRYYAGGTDAAGGIGTQRNGVFFFFDGGLDLPKKDDPPNAVLSIDKVSDKYVHKIGDTWDYTIKVKNVTKESQAVTAKSVKVTDTVPSGLKVNSVKASKGTASNNGNSVTANLGDLAQDAVETVTINVTALESSNGKQLYNKAKAEADNARDVQDDGNYVNSADVTVDKVVDKYEFAVGEKANFTVKVKNNKGIAAGVDVTDALPSGMKLDYDSVKISGLPASVTIPVQGPTDVTNELNADYFNKSETKTITATKSQNGDNGWAYKINYLPAGSTATITFSATATEAGNGKEEWS